MLLILKPTGVGTACESYAPAYDGNGNVMTLVRIDDGGSTAGDLAGRYTYDPYGNELYVEAGGDVAQGLTFALSNPFRFSTKYRDAETNLLYFGYRYYNTQTGKWLNRDPIEEQGGINVYGYVGNGPVYHIDMLGLADWDLALEYGGQMSTGISQMSGGLAILLTTGGTAYFIGGGALVTDGFVRFGTGTTGLIIALQDDRSGHARAQQSLPGGAIDGTIGLISKEITKIGGGSELESEAVRQIVTQTGEFFLPGPKIKNTYVQIVLNIDTLKQIKGNVALTNELVQRDLQSNHSLPPSIDAVRSPNKSSYVQAEVTLLCPESFRSHVVRQGDSLWKIWRRRTNKNVPWNEMLKANNFLKNPNRLKPGWSVCAPDCHKSN